MFGIFWDASADRRSLFTCPFLWGSPLRRTFPTCGFFEVSLSPLTGDLAPVRVSCA
jgi:NADH:ubiquinone oxidoreductase subunit C